ncbi:ATP-binding cassette domain-containing protein [Tateyamaria omphalii]|uniref:ATP-binding cassette domain-containing protein n=1 Tax=Tateyamaria omphalii TaxID=299262 RepID=UPI001C99A69F|nr:ATP-binding cassette domain-containing protein [Tateyamaria omphalii]MBY5934939.1 ATP-binding cassette domain-containing protein [Tateyamaria omphalii]
MTSALMELRNIDKFFGSTKALRNVSMSVQPGKILCLLGDNGAGKSTLIKVLSGYHQPTNGQLFFEGGETRFSGPREARQRGIATVHQNVGSIPLMSVGRNFFLGAEPTKGPRFFRSIDTQKANAIAVEQMQKFGLTRVTNGEQLVGTMSGGERQVLAIGRAMYFGAKMLILDEPTSALGVKEASIVLKMMRIARKNGAGIVFITHNARHAMSVGDDFCVLIQGEVAARFKRNEKSREEVLNLMAGGEDMTELEDDLEQID